MIPRGIHFVCPYCNRPVIPAAMGLRSPSRLPYAKSPHFKHRRNDEWARQCQLYQSGTSTVLYDSIVPSLLMLLRRVQSRDHADAFRVEFSLRRRRLTFLKNVLSDDDVITVDGERHSLRYLTERRGRTITISHPLGDVESRILIPEKWWKYVGSAENSRGVMLFSDAFGTDGGRYLCKGAALHTGIDYYVVTDRRRGRELESIFDVSKLAGRLIGESKTVVYRVRVSPTSHHRNRVDDWLGTYGYCLSDVDRSAQLVWPPSLRSFGVDEPLFRRSMPIYQFPYRIPGSANADRVDRRSFDLRNSRSIGFVGFDRELNPTYELESSCLFFKPNRHMPWGAVLLGRTFPDDLHPAEIDMPNTFDGSSVMATSEGTSGFTGEDPRLLFGHGADVARRRMRQSPERTGRNGSQGERIARTREGI
ncbi:hypothetical protein Uis1B_1203 [Bifidobacterium margollesii]|uniref:Uncharacterized protein n=2 Tax=Bifidobacterium margollesii TaxID=2020964 RepID=A0A2N5J9M0_9BIFI|nr:hypothetical protein Uis1B_1203 [Bifidobacterium margollesii]